MSYSKEYQSQELGKGTAPQASLQPEYRAVSGEVGLPKKRAQVLADDHASTEPLESKHDPLHPETVLTNTTHTKDEPPQNHTDELRHTDELCYTDEFYAYREKRNEKIFRFDEGLKTTEKLISESHSQQS